MNYIVFSEKIETCLQEEYRILCSEQKYMDSFEEYVNTIFHYGTEIRIFNRVHDESEYQIIGKGYWLKAGRHHKNEDCFYAYRIDQYKDHSKYLEVFSQTEALPGEWRLISWNRGGDVWKENTTPIDDFLKELKGSYKEYYEFKDRWEHWDTYNSKLNDLSEKKEKESECSVLQVILEHNVFSIGLSDLKKEYKEDSMVSVKIKGNDRFINLGKIISVDTQKSSVEIEALNDEIVSKYRNGEIGIIEIARIADHGTKARLRRQKEALKRLFDSETANKNLKEILMGNFEFGNLEVHADLIKNADGLFGTNQRQEQAYKDALSADDIYMIQGPPGTGKTTVITEIVKKIVEDGKSVLVSSETNIAVDNVLEKIEHQNGVIAVRLGKEERIGFACQSFMPEHIASVIRQEAVDIIRFRESQKNLFENYRQEIEEKWKKKIRIIEQKIESIEEILPKDIGYDLLYREILSYGQNAKLLNDLYTELMVSKNEYHDCGEQLKKLKKELFKSEAKIKVLREESMKSGFRAVDKRTELVERDLLSERNRLEKEVEFTEKKLSAFSYENKKTSYLRKIKRIDAEKNKLMTFIHKKTDFSKEIFQLKQCLEDLMELRERKSKLLAAMESEIEEAGIHFERDRELLEKSKEIRVEWLEILNQPTILETLENLYLKKTNVVFATCTGIASLENGTFAQREYDYVIVDEAAKCNTLDLLIPLVMGKKIILVGDHKQLYPMLETEGLDEEFCGEEIQELKEHTLFKWLFEERVPAAFKIMMNKQYRMPFLLSQFASENFYNGELESEKQDTGECMYWIDIPESEEKQKGNSTSFYNEKEAAAVCRLIDKLDRSLMEKTEIGVICTYKAQADNISHLLTQKEYKNVIWECSTVDAFQGKEKSIIIFNTVRSVKCNPFVSDPNRTNVAVTRAKDLLYIVGNSNILKHRNAGVLRNLYDTVSKHGRIYNENYLEI